MVKLGALIGQQMGRSLRMIEFSFLQQQSRHVADKIRWRRYTPDSLACVGRCASVEATEL